MQPLALEIGGFIHQFPPTACTFLYLHLRVQLYTIERPDCNLSFNPVIEFKTAHQNPAGTLAYIYWPIEVQKTPEVIKECINALCPNIANGGESFHAAWS